MRETVEWSGNRKITTENMSTNKKVCRLVLRTKMEKRKDKDVSPSTSGPKLFQSNKDKRGKVDCSQSWTLACKNAQHTFLFSAEP